MVVLRRLLALLLELMVLSIVWTPESPKTRWEEVMDPKDKVQRIQEL
jgi:hypothetical protein